MMVWNINFSGGGAAPPEKIPVVAEAPEPPKVYAYGFIVVLIFWYNMKIIAFTVSELLKLVILDNHLQILHTACICICVFSQE